MTSIMVKSNAPKFIYSRLAAFEVLLKSYTEFKERYIDNKSELNAFDRSLINMTFRMVDYLIIDLRDTYFNEMNMKQFITQKHIHFILSDDLVSLTELMKKNYNKVSLTELVDIKAALMEYYL